VNAILDALVGWDFYVVSQGMKALRLAGSKPERTAALDALERDNPPEGERLRKLTEAAFAEEWKARKETQS
jgi:hypothetical protein